MDDRYQLAIVHARAQWNAINVDHSNSYCETSNYPCCCTPYWAEERFISNLSTRSSSAIETKFSSQS